MIDFVLLLLFVLLVVFAVKSLWTLMFIAAVILFTLYLLDKMPP